MKIPESHIGVGVILPTVKYPKTIYEGASLKHDSSTFYEGNERSLQISS